MQTEGYEFVPNEDNEVYIFFSSGFKGIITKVVMFEKLNIPYSYNLMFGDYKENSISVDDLTTTNNGDTVKVLATVIQIIRDFFTKYPKAEIQIEGSTEIRTRLYQKILRNNLEEIQKDFIVYGVKNDNLVEIFQLTGLYIQFKIRKK
jgi:hypothetical protein